MLTLPTGGSHRGRAKVRKSYCKCTFGYVEGHMPVRNLACEEKKLCPKLKKFKSLSHQKVMQVNLGENIKEKCMWLLCNTGECQQLRYRQRMKSSTRRLKDWQGQRCQPHGQRTPILILVPTAHAVIYCRPLAYYALT